MKRPTGDFETNFEQARLKAAELFGQHKYLEAREYLRPHIVGDKAEFNKIASSAKYWMAAALFIVCHGNGRHEQRLAQFDKLLPKRKTVKDGKTVTVRDINAARLEISLAHLRAKPTSPQRSDTGRCSMAKTYILQHTHA